MDQCADAGPNSPRSPHISSWATRRAKYGPAGHGGYSRRVSPLERAALRLIAKLHSEEMLSEGQCCQALGLDRVEFREICDSFGPGATVGERLAAARAERGLTQADLAEALGVSRPQVANIEAGRSALSVEQLMTAALALSISAADLLPGAARATGPASPHGNSGTQSTQSAPQEGRSSSTLQVGKGAAK